MLRNLPPSGVPSLGREPWKTVSLGQSVRRFYRSVLGLPWTGAQCRGSAFIASGTLNAAHDSQSVILKTTHSIEAPELKNWLLFQAWSAGLL